MMHKLPADVRLILAHKQRTSARVRFLRFAHGLMGFASLPALSALDDDAPSRKVAHHPRTLLRAAELQLGLPSGSLEHEPEFHATVQTPDGSIEILLALFATTDPPFAEAEAAGGRFVAITEVRGCPPVEMGLLRKAYEVLLG